MGSDDGRRVLVSLTASGSKEAARLTELTERSILGLMSRIPAKERAQVARSLRLLREAAEASRSGLRCC
jgi:DNA-binding MarR family transcriptional regulator